LFLIKQVRVRDCSGNPFCSSQKDCSGKPGNCAYRNKTRRNWHAQI